VDFSLDQAGEVLQRTPIDGAESEAAWSPYQVVGHLTHVEEVDWIDRTRIIFGQAVKTMAKQYTEAVGPWRGFLPIVDAP
jgi:hypothetical protein